MENLTDNQKALLKTDLVEKVKAQVAGAEDKIETVLSVEAPIEALPDVDELTVEDAEAVKAAEAAYNALSADEKALVNVTLGSKLYAAKVKLEQLAEGDKGPEKPGDD
jgi:YbbR domain-containing protein